MGRIAIILWCFYGYLAAADLRAADTAAWLPTSDESSRTKQAFLGLKFTTDAKLAKCALDPSGAVLCQLSNRGISPCQLVIKRQKYPRPPSLPLARLARKQLWQKENPLLNQYVEESLATGLGQAVLQSARGYHLNNIALPLLLRAFDVVVDSTALISVTTKCDFGHWPALDKEVKSIEASLVVAKK